MSSKANQPWGPESSFKIAVPDTSIQTIKQKLALATYPDEIEDAGWDYGAPLANVKRLTEYWQNGYDWRKHERELNESLPQFQRRIDVEGHGSLNIHYVHQKSETKSAIPLLFVHGWPGCFLEVRKILPLLISPDDPNTPAFHVVALSHPNFGFSDGAKKKGFGLNQYAEVGHKLMLSLGYDQYVTQGGDWGFSITQAMAQNYGAKHTKAWHVNFVVPPIPSLTSHPLAYLSTWLGSFFTAFSSSAKRDQDDLAQLHYMFANGMGYSKQQGTKPQTLGYALADSPVGLLAWIYEKLVDWTDRREAQFSDDEVLTLVSIYAFSTAGSTAAGRIYYETHDGSDRDWGRPKSKVPMGVTYLPKEAFRFPHSWSKLVGNVVFENTHESGGHFAALEEPEKLAGDLRKMFGKGGKAFGVVDGLTGYD